MLLACSFAVVVRPASGQQVAEIQALPANLLLSVGSQFVVMATTFDARGFPLRSVQAVWASNNVKVARVVPNPDSPTATVFGVSAGIAQIEARVGSVTSIIFVQVSLALPQAQPERPPVAARTDNPTAQIRTLPSSLTLDVGDSPATVIAVLFDARGEPVTTSVPITWVSNNLAVASVSVDRTRPDFATITALSPGVARIEAISGNVRSWILVTVRPPLKNVGRHDAGTAVQLSDAAKLDDVKAVIRLIEDGADVNAVNIVSGNAALQYASSQGHGEIVSVLLANGADVNAKTSSGKTASKASE